MSDYRVGQHITVKLSGGRLVDAEIKAIVATADGERGVTYIKNRLFSLGF